MKLDIFDGDIRDLYEAIARDEPKTELLQRVYDIFGDHCYLRPPAHERRVAALCDTRQAHNG